MDGKWIEVEPEGAVRDGDVGGDAQVSDSWSRQFVLPRNADGLLPVLTVRHFVARRNHNDEGDERVCLRRQVEYMLCTDLTDPGGTEEWSDTAEQDLTGLPWTPTNEDARRACDEAPVPALTDWDGTRAHGEGVLRKIALANARAARA